VCQPGCLAKVFNRSNVTRKDANRISSYATLSFFKSASNLGESSYQIFATRVKGSDTLIFFLVDIDLNLSATSIQKLMQLAYLMSQRYHLLISIAFERLQRAGIEGNFGLEILHCEFNGSHRRRHLPFHLF